MTVINVELHCLVQHWESYTYIPVNWDLKCMLFIYTRIYHLYTPVSTITKVYSIEEVIRTQGSGKDNSFSGIVYALLMSLNIDNDPARVVSFRW